MNNIMKYIYIDIVERSREIIVNKGDYVQYLAAQ